MTTFSKFCSIPNAGGSSIYSEALAYQILEAKYGHKLYQTECQVQYSPLGGRMVDMVTIYKDKYIGVSVTRMFDYSIDFSIKELLEKKIKGLLDATRNIDYISSRILFVWVKNKSMKFEIQKIWPILNSSDITLIIKIPSSKLYYPIFHDDISCGLNNIYK